ncbi:MAG: arylamine N-acetyltransferase [Planctomycetota bacterium]
MDPLSRPANRELLREFCSIYRIPREGDPRRLLGQVARAFSRVPYENLTKILSHAERGSTGAACRTPREVLGDHRRWQAGGTCFSLTATLLYLVRSLGFEAEPILADRRYGADTHSALIVWIDHRPHLLDPGYLIVDPIPLAEDPKTLVLPTRFNELKLVPSGRDCLALYTVQQNECRYRLTFKVSPVDASQFRRVWEASFDWEMMRAPVLTMVSGNQQLYMHGGRLQRRSQTGVHREKVPEPLLPERMAREFGIDAHVIHQALQVLRRRGD